jgi:glutamate/tyrosine decarboxylase-like PLP-dependent enzyme
MDVDTLTVPTGKENRLTGAGLRAALDADPDADSVFAVVATAGTTNTGTIDDLAGVVEVAHERGLWVHVDGAYGLAGLAAPSVRDQFVGIEAADSFVVDPHKWLFAPFDCAALVYRDPETARHVHSQMAPYLDSMRATEEWNPADYAYHLTRRARGLPFWFSLAVHGTDAYARAVERTLEVARFAEAEIGRRERLELLRERDLSVMVFRRIGWAREDYQAWSDRLLADEFAFVVPTTHEGETVTRFAIVNPTTTEDDILAILDTMT